jgi:hypothetical protein
MQNLEERSHDLVENKGLSATVGARRAVPLPQDECRKRKQHQNCWNEATILLKTKEL